MEKLRPLTLEEVSALRAYKAKHGRKWKSVLSGAWMGHAPYDDGGTLRNLRNTHGPSWLDGYRLPEIEPEGPWEMSGPEEGDGDDTVLVCNYLDDGRYEVIEITAGTLAKRKSIARRIARLLNEGEGRRL